MWVIGIDEAGYGPNLGPLVQAAVAVQLPDDDDAGWSTLSSMVRRSHEPKDGRLLIDDSKKVHARGGLAALERGVFGWFGTRPISVIQYLACASPQCLEDLQAEYWFDPHDMLPVEAPEKNTKHHTRLERIEHRRCTRARIVPAPRFNALCDAEGSKGMILARGLVSLMSEMVNFGLKESDDSVLIHCDKLGGRNYYAAMIQKAFPECWVAVIRESAGESCYRVDGLPRQIIVRFRPRADAESVAVALASMQAKYLREVLMRQFNSFWLKQIPGLKPTAGYPTDAKRYFAEIRETARRLGIREEAIWRKR